MGEKYIQVGVMGLRAPGGEFIQSAPLYKKVNTGKSKKAPCETAHYEDIGKMFAAYVDGIKALGIETR